MTKIQAAEAATQALEKAFQHYTTTAQKLTEAEGRENQCRAAYEAAVADFDGDDRAQRRVREASDELAMAKAMVGRLKKDAKEASVDLITPSRVAKEAVRAAAKEARAENEASLYAAVRPFFQDDDVARRAVSSLEVGTKAQTLLRGRPADSFDIRAGIEVIAGMIIRDSRETLRRLASI